MRNKNYLKILMFVLIMLVQISYSAVYYSVEEKGKGKITISYEKATKTFLMTAKPEGSTLSRDKMQEFYKKIDRENMNNRGYTLELKNKIKAPVDSSYLFSFEDDDKILYIEIKGLENLDVSNVISMKSMFFGTINVNPDVNNWNVSNVKDMSGMFAIARQANPNVSNWNVSNVINMKGMFLGTIKANPDVSNWNVSNVINMGYMFFDARQANPDVSKWNVSKVKNMSYMFSDARQANPDISKWDVSNVEYMSSMFYGASQANPDISKWNASKLKNVKFMFYRATKFISETEAKIDRLENKTEVEKKELKSYITDGNVEHLKKLIYELKESKK